MVRIILWSDESNASQAGQLASDITKELNIVAESLSNSEAMELIKKIGGRDKSRNGHLLFINGNSDFSTENIREILAQANNFSGQFGTYSIENGGTILSFPELESANLHTAISPSQQWALGAVVVDEELCEGLEEYASVPEALIKMAIRSIGDSGINDYSLATIEVSASTEQSEVTFTDEICSSLLLFAVKSVNIEELFPNHSWQKFAEESAAASYHTLAARFISLNDTDSAKDCLQFGDQFEDSPRSLALKGLIALREGEVLTAVANMVSSLQEYEKRKKDDNAHYLSFKPRNLEVINTSLQSGLAALNKRENDAAAEYFTDAVFEFDQFFTECGLEQPKVQ